MSDDMELRAAVRRLVDPGSMPLDTIVEELSDDFNRREIKLAVVSMIEDGALEEHPEFDDVCRVPDDP